MKFQKGDIIEFCNETFEVLEVYSDRSGKVVDWYEGNRGSEIVNNFYWSYDGEDCKLIQRAK